MQFVLFDLTSIKDACMFSFVFFYGLLKLCETSHRFIFWINELSYNEQAVKEVTCWNASFAFQACQTSL